METLSEQESRQKSFILEYVKLGMDFYSAAVLSECDPSFIARLEQDEEFNKDIEYIKALKEKELLDLYNKRAVSLANHGDLKGLERLLEINNPDKYSKVTKLAHTLGKGKNGGRIPSAIKIEFVGTEDGK